MLSPVRPSVIRVAYRSVSPLRGNNKTPWIVFRGHLRSRILGSLKSRWGTVYYCIIMWALKKLERLKERCEQWASKISITTLSFGAPVSREPLWIAQTYKLESLAYILPLTVCVYLHSDFSGGLQKTISFLKEWRFSRSRNQGHPRSFLLVPIESAYATCY